MTTIKIGLIGAAAAVATMAAPLAIQHQSQAKLRAANEALSAQLAQLSQPAPSTASTDTTVSAALQEAQDAQEKELASLRSEVTRLRQDSAQLAQLKSRAAQGRTDALAGAAEALLAKVNALKQRLEEHPDQGIPELQYLKTEDWFRVALDAKLDTDNGYRQALGRLRSIGKQDFAPTLRKGLNGYVDASGGQLPIDVSQLQPYFGPEVGYALLNRYKLVRSGDAQVEKGQDQSVLTEKAAVDPEYDSLMSVGPNGMTFKGNGGGMGMGFSTRLTSIIRKAGDTNGSHAGGGGFGVVSGTGISTNAFLYMEGAGATNAAPR